MAQSVKRPTSAQIVISQSVSSSPASGSVLTAQSLEPASDSVFPSLSALPPLMFCLSKMNKHFRGAWVAQSVKHPNWAWVIILPVPSSSPTSGSVLTARSLEPASDSVSPSLSAPSPLAFCLSLSQK